MKNKYSHLKIALHKNKLDSIINKNVSAPTYVRIKPTNRCNHNCFFCIYNESYANMHNHMGYKDELSREKLLEILEDFKEIGVKAITYSGGGEPLIHPNIEEIMEKTLEYDIDLSIITNGQKLSGRKAEILAKAKWVRISMDYYDSKGFKISKRGSARMYDEIIENIKEFSNKPHKCDIEINFIITKENYLHLEESVKLLKPLGIENIRYSPVWIKNMEEYHKPIRDTVIAKLKLIKELYQDDFFKIYTSYNKNSIINTAAKRSYNFCSFMQIVPVIGADYNVYNCHNQAYSKNGILGSINNQKFSELWFSKNTAKYFESFDPQINCDGIQCAADSKNMFINELINTSPDNFI